MTDHAHELRLYAPLLGRPTIMLAAADEIERLRAENAGLVDDMNLLRDNNTALRARIEEMEKQEPVATVSKKGADRYWMSERMGTLPDGTHPLYLAPGAKGE